MAHPFLHKNPMKPVIIQQISYKKKDKKTTVKDKCKNSKILRERGVEALKPYSKSLKTFLCSIVPFLTASKVICELSIMWQNEKKGEKWVKA